MREEDRRALGRCFDDRYYLIWEGIEFFLASIVDKKNAVWPVGQCSDVQQTRWPPIDD